MNPITITVTAAWRLPHPDDPQDVLVRSANVAQYLHRLVGAPAENAMVTQDGDQLEAAWQWTMPEFHLGFRNRIYDDLAGGTTGILATLLLACPAWMPPLCVIVAGSEGERFDMEDYISVEDGDPKSYAADLIALLNR